MEFRFGDLPRLAIRLFGVFVCQYVHMEIGDAPRTNAPDPSFFGVAPSLARNPLGIVALALVLVYALASVVTFGTALDTQLRAPLVWFLVVYPVLVLGVFAWLIAKHPNRLYAPTDFRNDDAFLAATQGQLKSVAFLSAAQARRDRLDAVGPEDEQQVSKVVETVVRRVREGGESQILWVDDRPENNVWERQAFMAAGAEIKLALNTTQALELLGQQDFDLVISDMGRVEGDREGYVLLDAMRQRRDKTPLVFYATSNSPAHKKETREHGGQGCTNSPTELFDLGMALITRL